MKSFRLVVTLLVFVGLVASVGFAANANRASASHQKGILQARGLIDRNKLESDVSRIKSAPARTINMLQAKPAATLPSPKMKSTLTLTSGLSGTYHIPGDFPTIESAVSVLNFLGVAGDVTFELDAATYTENSITFGAFPGAGTHTVTVTPAAGLAVTVNFQSLNTDGKGFAFNGAAGVTIDGVNAGSSLTLGFAGGVFPLGDPFGATIYVTGLSDHIAIKNTSIMGQVNNAVWANQTEARPAVFVFQVDADGGPVTNLTIDGCTMTNASYGIKVLAQSGTYNSLDGATITNNHIGGAYGNPVVIGGLYEYTARVTFTHNTIDGSDFLDWYWNNAYTEWDDDEVFYTDAPFMFTFGQSTAAHFLLADQLVFADNVIRNVSVTGVAGEGLLTYGTRVYQYNLGYGVNADVYNNLIYDLSNPGGTSAPTGGAQINGIRGPAGNVYHNSIRLTGTSDAYMTTNCVNGVSVGYNNAFSNEMTGGTASGTRGIAQGGTFDNNAVYSTGRYVSSLATMNDAVAAGINPHGVFGPVGFNPDLTIGPTGPSSAESIGRPHIPVLTDHAGNPVDTTNTGTRDAGAYQFATLTNAFGPDVFPTGVIIAASTPVGLSQQPIVSIKNNAPTAVGSFNLTVTIAPNGYSQTISVPGLAGLAEQSFTLPAWVAVITDTGTQTLTATTALGGDVNTGNDSKTGSTTVTPPYPVPNSVVYDFNSGAQGWSGTNDWALSNSFTKLGGPLDGSSWVTQSPYNHATYTEGAYANTQGYSSTYPGPNLLSSPWLDLSGVTGDSLYVSFSHSINVEPGWDGAWFEYTTDGVHWKHLGHLNDPNGINWYSSSVYANAQSLAGDPPDTATMLFSNYNLYGPGSSNPTLPISWWTSNGDPNGADVPLGPTGWIFNQLKITTASYPDIIHAPLIKFRYVAFSDAATAFDGWAVDNVKIGNVGASFSGGSITGTAFQDNNGNGTFDGGEALITGAKVYKSYFGVLKDSTTTSGSGTYSFSVDLPGVYNIMLGVTGTAYSVPFNSATGNVNHPADGSTLTQNFGTYNGSISGTVYEDLNDNAAKDGGEPGKGGWTVQARLDSATGPVVGSVVSASDGSYQILTAPASYVLIKTSQTSARQTEPADNANRTVTISGNSGSGTAVSTGNDFGVWYFGTVRVALEVDLNGDGVRQATDQAAMPGLNYEAFEFLHNGVRVGVDTIGKGATSVALHTLLDTAGDYGVHRISPIPAGWINTTHNDSVTFKITTSSTVDTASTLAFKLVIVNGTVFADLNGNGGKDGGENGVFGKVVTISGAGTVSTDSSGFYADSAVGPGTHNITLAAEAGVTQTSGPYSFTAQSGNFPASNQFGKNFGQFTNTTVSGTVYRDRNNSGTRDAGEEGLSGWVVNMGRWGSQTSDANGNYSFPDIGPGADTLTETLQAGFVQTAPPAPYMFSLTSGTPTTGQDFGNSSSADSIKYRTFTAAQLGATSEKKGGKAPKPGKLVDPIKNIINTANLLSDIFLQGGQISVGLPGQLNAGGKEKRYIAPLKQGDVWASFNAKGVFHTGAPRGLDVDNKGGLMLKKVKNLPPTKKNDVLIADLLAFKVNLAASAVGKTPTGLGALVYYQPDQPFSGLTLDQIADSADYLMTNWEGIPFSVYIALDSITAKVNAVFASGTVLDTATGWFSPKITWKAYTAVDAVSFLHASGAKPQNRIGPVPTPYIPKVYALMQNYPNPFNPTTAIQFDLPQSSIVTLKIYNVLGQEVATLLDHQAFDLGNQEVDFDASALASGVYLYRIVAQPVNDDGANTGSTFTQVKKMMLIK